MRRPLALGVLGACLALAGCGGGSSSEKNTTASTASGPARVDRYGCVRAAQPAPKAVGGLHKPSGRLDPAKTWTVRIETNCGTFAIRLAVAGSPKTTASFASLVRKRFFDDLTFHRISPGFVIQGGDPRGDGQGGPGYTVVEPPPRSQQYTRGVVAMAKTQTEPSGASGSQFFVVTAEDANASAGLTPDYAVLGKVVSGLGVVNRIGSIPSDPQTEAPSEPVVMKRVTLSSR